MIDPNLKISPNFRLGEFFVTSQPGGQVGLAEDLKALPKEEQADILLNIRKLASQLEAVRKECAGRSIHITSGWRSKRVNKAVGGRPNSYHLLGMAADIVVDGLTPAQVQQRLDGHWPGGLGYGKSFTHLDIRSKRERFSY